MTNEKSVIVEFFGNYPLIRVLDFLIENRGFDYSKTDISRGAKVSWGSLYGLWNKIEQLGMVIPTRSFGTGKISKGNFCAQSATKSLIRETRLYKLNEKNSFVKRILRMELDLIKFYAEVDTIPDKHETPVALPMGA